MKKWTKKLAACLIAFCLLSGTVVSASADTTATNVTETYSLATLTGGDGIIEVPVKRQVIQPRSTNGLVTSKATVMVPDMTEEELERNAEYVRQIKETGTITTPRDSGSTSFGETGRLWFTSTINYNVDYYKDYYRIYDLMSFRLDREIYTMAPYNRINNATAKVNQVGSIGDPGDLELLTGQSRVLGEIQYGTTYTEGNAWPGGWMAVGKVDNYAEIGAVYDVRLDYADGSSRTLNFTHYVV